MEHFELPVPDSPLHRARPDTQLNMDLLTCILEAKHINGPLSHALAHDAWLQEQLLQANAKAVIEFWRAWKVKSPEKAWHQHDLLLPAVSAAQARASGLDAAAHGPRFGISPMGLPEGLAELPAVARSKTKKPAMTATALATSSTTATSFTTATTNTASASAIITTATTNASITATTAQPLTASSSPASVAAVARTAMVCSTHAAMPDTVQKEARRLNNVVSMVTSKEATGKTSSSQQAGVQGLVASSAMEMAVGAASFERSPSPRRAACSFAHMQASSTGSSSSTQPSSLRSGTSLASSSRAASYALQSAHLADIPLAMRLKRSSRTAVVAAASSTAGVVGNDPDRTFSYSSNDAMCGSTAASAAGSTTSGDILPASTSRSPQSGLLRRSRAAAQSVTAPPSVDQPCPPATATHSSSGAAASPLVQQPSPGQASASASPPPPSPTAPAPSAVAGSNVSMQASAPAAAMELTSPPTAAAKRKRKGAKPLPAPKPAFSPAAAAGPETLEPQLQVDLAPVADAAESSTRNVLGTNTLSIQGRSMGGFDYASADWAPSMAAHDHPGATVSWELVTTSFSEAAGSVWQQVLGKQLPKLIQSGMARTPMDLLR